MRAIFKKQAVPVKPSLWCFVDRVNIPEHSFSLDHGTLYKDLGTEPRAPRSPAQPHSQSCVFHPAPSRPPQDAHANREPSKKRHISISGLVGMARTSVECSKAFFLKTYTVMDSKGRNTSPSRRFLSLLLVLSSLFLALSLSSPAAPPLGPPHVSPTQTSLTTPVSVLRSHSSRSVFFRNSVVPAENYRVCDITIEMRALPHIRTACTDSLLDHH